MGMLDRFRKHSGVDPGRVPSQLTEEIAWAESKLFMRDVSKFNPDDLIGRKGFGIYSKMMIDEQVKAVVHFKRDAITSRDFFFEFSKDVDLPDSERDKRISIYNASVDEMRGSFTDGLNYIMKAIYQGFSMTEKTFDVFLFEGVPYLGISRLTPKPYETFEFEVTMPE